MMGKTSKTKSSDLRAPSDTPRSATAKRRRKAKTKRRKRRRKKRARTKEGAKKAPRRRLSRWAVKAQGGAANLLVSRKNGIRIYTKNPSRAKRGGRGTWLNTRKMTPKGTGADELMTF